MLAGYSGTPLPKKLGIKLGSVVTLVDSPKGFADVLEAQTTGFVFSTGEVQADVILLFAEWEARLLELLPIAIPRMRINGGLWIAWPKRASKVPTDITEDRLRDILLPQGLVDNKVCAIDEKWSGLRFVWRVENRR
jgi:hypothetical protein